MAITITIIKIFHMIQLNPVYFKLEKIRIRPYIVYIDMYVVYTPCRDHVINLCYSYTVV